VSPENNPVYVATGLSNQFMQCNNCGHHGMVFPEVPESQAPKKPKDIKEIKNIQFVQTSFGKGYLKYWVYIGIPLTVLTLILLFFTR